MDSKGIVTFKSNVQLTEEQYTIIAHVRFYVKVYIYMYVYTWI